MIITEVRGITKSKLHDRIVVYELPQINHDRVVMRNLKQTDHDKVVTHDLK